MELKFICHNLKMLTNRLHNHGWVLGELFVVFIVLWFLCDSIGCLTYTVTRPQGFDYSHIYEVQLTQGGEARDTSHTYTEKLLMLRDRLRRMDTVVEAVGMHASSDPMGATNRWGSFLYGDSSAINVRMGIMDDGMMQIFRFRPAAGQKEFATMPVSGSYGMITGRMLREIRENNAAFTQDSTLRDAGTNNPVHIYSVMEDFRPGRFEVAENWFIRRIDDNYILGNYIYPPTLMLRVLPQADRADFPDYFLRRIAPAIEVDNVMVMNLQPYGKTLDSHEQSEGNRDRLQTHSFIAIFLLVNVFMGIVGTFWYRTRRRRNEIALRLSMGSSRARVRRLLLGEGLILLTVVAVPAIIVCLNIAVAEPSVGNSPLIAVWPVEWSALRFVMGIAATWVLMAAMIVVGIWVPATQAMKIQPAEALHEE